MVALRTSPPHSPPRSLAPVVFVMGKGGVGKSTIAASLAVLEAETRGGAVLVELGDGEAGRRALAGAHRDVEHVVIRPEEAIQRAATPLFGSATLARLALGKFAMRPLLRVAPAIRELAMLESVRQVSAARPGVRVVVDMPATGHSVAWLRVPQQGRDFIESGPLFEICDRLTRELVAPGRVSIVLVTLPERLVLEETVELSGAIAAETGLRVDRVVVNRMPVALSPRALEDARAIAGASGPLQDAARALSTVLAARDAAREEGLAALAALTRAEHAMWCVPLAPVDPSAKDVARWLRAEGAA